MQNVEQQERRSEEPVQTDAVSVGPTSDRTEVDGATGSGPAVGVRPRKVVVTVVTDINEVNTIRKETNPGVYAMTKKSRGRCVIISNENFVEVGGYKMEPRVGTEKDAQELKSLFNQLQFTVVLHRDKTADEIKGIATSEAEREDQKDAECFVFIIMTHGSNKGVFGTDSQLVRAEEITTKFDGHNCKALRNRPKLFFLQACRGDYLDDKGQPVRKPSIDIADSVQFQCPPVKADILVAWSTHQDFVSTRNPITGALFIQAMIEVFKDHAHDKDILHLFTMINSKVSEENSFLGTSGGNPVETKQMPFVSFALKKKLYFFPGNWIDQQ